MYVSTYHPTLPPSASTVLGRFCRKMGVIDSFRCKGEVDFLNWVCVSLDVCWGGLLVLGVFVCLSLSSSQSRNGNTEGGTRRGWY